ncbi:MAG: Na+/H+ antiporter NhaA, partial [Pseudomonadota bacterium]|nr:Na+/H+ antiporter NhaA [Pseudomonadota bacterium]
MIPHGDRSDEIDDAIQHSPLETLEHALHPWVAYLILPVFAFANAGLALGEFVPSDVLQPVPLGILLGLLLGKPLGVVGMAVLAKATGIARYPEGMDFHSMLGLGLLCGIGFTMSLFIASLAFSDDGNLFQSAVLGVLVASVAAALAGYLWLRVTLPKETSADPG